MTAPPRPSVPYSRGEFERVRCAAKAHERKRALILASISVILGLAQLLFINWADQRLPRATAVPLEVTIFVLYLALVGWLVWRLERAKRTLAPRCPHCNQALLRLPERVAVATGRCDACGGQVIIQL